MMKFRTLVVAVIMLGFAAGLNAQLTQPASTPGNWVYELPVMPELSEIVARPQLERPNYGLYLWASEYLQFRKNINKVGWKSYRIAGPFSDECMAAVVEDDARIMVTLSSNVFRMNNIGEKKNRTNFKSDQAFIAAYTNAVVKFLERFGPGGKFFAENPKLPNHPVKDIEIWNEPNFQYMIPDPKYPGENEAARKIRKEVETKREKLYAKVLPSVYKAVKSRWPEVNIVGFGAGGASAGDRRFFTNVHKVSGEVGKSYDTLSTHPYARPAPPEGMLVRSWGKFGAADGLAHIHKVMKTDGDGIKPVWWTEYGWPLSKEEGGTYPTRSGGGRAYATPMLQAAYVVRGYLFAQRLGVDLVTIMHVTDTDGFNGGFFVPRDVQNWRPSAYAVRNLVEIMPNPKLLGAFSDGTDGYFAYRYRAEPASEAEVVVAWDVKGLRDVVIPLAAGTYKVVDMLGHISEMQADADGLKLQIGPCPTYISAK